MFITDAWSWKYDFCFFVFSGTYHVPVDTEVNVTFLSALAFFIHAAKLEFYSQRPWMPPFQRSDCLGPLPSSSDCLEFLGGRSVSCLFLAAGSVYLLCAANILGGEKNICFIRRKDKSRLAELSVMAGLIVSTAQSKWVSVACVMFASQSTLLFVYVSVWGRHKTEKDTCHVGSPGNKGVRGRGRYHVAFIFVQSPCSKELSCEPKVSLSLTVCPSKLVKDWTTVEV